MSQQLELARPFFGQFIKPPPKGKHGDYVPHDVVNQRLIQIFGFPPTFTLREIVRNPEGKVVGCVCRMEVNIDGHDVVIEEAGDEGFGSNDGDSLKKAMSDAYKRAAMRLGCALHLWSQEDYFLFDRLEKLEVGESRASEHGAEEPQASRSASPHNSEEGTATRKDAAMDERKASKRSHLPSSEPVVEGSHSTPASGVEPSPSELPAWLRALQKSYSDDAILRCVNEIRSERVKPAEREPLDDINEVRKARKETQEELLKRLAAEDWSAPKAEQGALA